MAVTFLENVSYKALGQLMNEQKEKQIWCDKTAVAPKILAVVPDFDSNR